MCTRLTRPILVALAAVPLCACGGSEGEPDTAPQQTEAPSAPVFGGDRSGETTTDAATEAPAETGEQAASTPETPETPAPTLPTSDVPFRDDSAEAALATYMDRLAAGDLLGAVEVCDPASPGTAELQTRAANIVSASQETGMSPETLIGFLIEGVADTTREETSRSDERVAFRRTPPNKPAKEIVVIRTPDGWRVQPPASGLPNA